MPHYKYVSLPAQKQHIDGRIYGHDDFVSHTTEDSVNKTTVIVVSVFNKKASSR